MSAGIVNLRRARKSRARAAKARQGDENAARHGQTRAERSLAKAEADKLARALEAHRREAPDGNRDD